MKTSVVWKEGMLFNGLAEDKVVLMDAKAPLGKGSAATPKELVALGLGGCTAMDVIALLKKYRQPAREFRVEVEIEPSSGSYPVVFEKATLTFEVTGDIQPEKLTEAVRLSQTQYCGVSAMLSSSFPIEYRVVLNGEPIGTGRADFEKHEKESK